MQGIQTQAEIRVWTNSRSKPLIKNRHIRLSPEGIFLYWHITPGRSPRERLDSSETKTKIQTQSSLGMASLEPEVVVIVTRSSHYL